MTFPLLFVGGIPGTGKSSFGEWLETNRGFKHVDLETKDVDHMGLRDQWEVFWQGGDAQEFLSSLGRLGSPVILDWGFPPSLIGVIGRLRDAGADLWWFDGDRLWARDLCMKAKGPSAAGTFDRQHSLIAAAWASIAALFGTHIVRTVSPDGQVKAWDDVWKMMRPSS